MRWKALFFLLPLTLLAQPKGLDVQTGQLSFKDGVITQSGSKAIAHWNDFSIGKGEVLRFVQPSKDAAVLNRVVGKNVSQILGSLKANGNVILINPNGVYISGDIQAGGFIASTADVSNENFLSGKELVFGETSGEITNAGHISCPGGTVYLVAKKVDNSGEIEGHQVIIRPHSNPKVLIRADDTDISSPYEKAISHTGTIRTFATKEEGGKIYLVAAEGATEVDGTLIGEEVHVLGQEVLLKENTYIDASGPSGGTVLIGGDYQGANPEILNAKNLYVAAGAEVKADSTVSGDGGKVIYWSDGITTVCGKTSVRGGPDGGDGGFIEVSGLKNFYYRGRNDCGAPKGQWGEILFDPDSDVTVAAGADTNMSAGPSFAPTADTANLTPTTLVASLDAGNVTLVTENAGGTEVGDLTFSSPVSWGSGATPNTTFTCTAGNDVTFDADVTNTGSGTFTVNAGATQGTIITVSSGVTVTNSGGGDIVFQGASGAGTSIVVDGGTVSATGVTSGNIDFNVGATLGDFDDIQIINGGTVSTTSGDITFRARSDSPTISTGIEVSGASTVSTSSGTITMFGLGDNDSGTDSMFGISVSGVGTEISAGTGGAIALTGVGGGSLSSSTNCDGVRIFDSAEVTGTGSASVSITGRTATSVSSFNNGIETFTGAVIQTETGSLTLDGRGTGGAGSGSANDGIRLDSTTVSSLGGAISLIGVGAGATSGPSNGIEASIVTITNTGSGTISLTGTPNGVDSGSSNEAVRLDDTSISVVDGDISITGNAPPSRAGGGISAASSSSITSTGAGDIELEGFSSAVLFGAGGFILGAEGILISGSSVTTSGSGMITFTGEGSGTNGIDLQSGASVTTTTGTITMTGTVNLLIGGGPSLGVANGIEISGSTVSSTSGMLTLSGTSLPSGTTKRFSTSRGIQVDGSSTLSSEGGVSLTGVGAISGFFFGLDAGAENHGIIVLGSSSISTTAAPITLHGTGGRVATETSGVVIGGTASITSSTGTISITGIPNPGVITSGDDNNGIVMSGGTVSSTGSGTVTLVGTGALNAGTRNHGVSLSTVPATITSSGGAISVTGTAGGDGTANCDGIILESGADITGTGSAPVTLTGTGGTNGNTSDNDGIVISGVGTVLSSASGTLSLTGTGGGTTTGNKGIRIDSGGALTSTSGTVTAMGTGGPGTSANDGVFVTDATSAITAVSSATFDVTGTGSGSAGPGRGISVESGALVENTGSATITLDGTGNGIGTTSYGIELLDLGTTIENSGTGTLTLTGRENGATTTGLHLGSSANVNATSTGGITLRTLSDLLIDSSGSMTTTGAAPITFNAAANLIITGGATFSLDSGLGLFIAGVDIDISGSTFTATSGNFTFVVDNDFPTFPGVGAGGFTFGTSTITTPAELRIYTARQSQNSAAGETINGVVFVPGPVGVSTATEKFDIYFPDGTYGGGAFTFYYKEPFTPPPPPVAPSAATSLEFNRDVAANLTQLADLLPVLRAPRLPYQFPNYHFSICTEDGECDPDFSPYGSFIFEDDLYWIPKNP